MLFYQDLGFLVLGSRLRRLSETWLGDINAVYQQQKIPFDASWFPIFYILSEKEKVSIKEIADLLEVSHSAVSQLCNNLQQKNLIAIVPTQTDKRKKAITLTVKGNQLLKKIKPVWKALELAMNEIMTDPQIALCLPVLTALENKLKDATLLRCIQKQLK